MDRTFALIRTNPRLSTNVMLMTSETEMYLDSIDAIPGLKRRRFKGFRINPSAYLPDVLAEYWAGVPNEEAYFVPDNEALLSVEIEDYSSQWRTLHWAGARTLASQYYPQEFQYFAPLYFSGVRMPTAFVVFRVDGSGIDLTVKETFRRQVLDELKVAAYFAINTETPLGQLVAGNHMTEDWPRWSVYWDWDQTEMCRVRGIDKQRGGLIDSPVYMGEWLRTDRRPFELEERVTWQFADEGVIDPHILNVNWMFDDSPSDAESKRDWSINRYYGFYVDEFTPLPLQVTYYRNPDFSGSVDTGTVRVTDQKVTLSAGQDLFDPHLPVGSSYDYWYLGSWYNFRRTSQTEWVVTGEAEELEGLTLDAIYSGSRPYEVEWRPNPSNANRVELVSRVNAPYADGFGLNALVEPFFSALYQDFDVVLQRLDDALTAPLVRLEYNRDPGNVSSLRVGYFLNVDGVIRYDDGKIVWRRAGKDETLVLPYDKLQWPVLTFDGCVFTDVMDWDYTRLDTNYSLFEYYSQSDLGLTEEARPIEIRTSTIGFLNQMPARVEDVAKTPFRDFASDPGLLALSSEYSLSQELWESRQNEGVSEIWNPYQTMPKWSYWGSVSHATEPYPLSNSNYTNETYNKGANVRNQRSVRGQRNLDWFLTSLPDDRAGWSWHSLHLDHSTTEHAVDFDAYAEGEWTYYYGLLTDVDTDWVDVVWGRTKIRDLPTRYRNPQWATWHSDGGSNSQWSCVWRGVAFRLGKVNVRTVDDNGRTQVQLRAGGDFSDWRMSCVSVLRTIRPDDVADNQFVLADGTPVPWTVAYAGGTKRGVSLGLHVVFNQQWRTVTVVLVASVIAEEASTLGVKRDAMYDVKKLYKVLTGLTADVYLAPDAEYCRQVLGPFVSDASVAQNAMFENLPDARSIFNISTNLLQPDMFSAAYMVYAINSLSARTYSMPVQHHVVDPSGDVSVYPAASSPYVLYATQPQRVDKDFYDYVEPLEAGEAFLSEALFRNNKSQPFTLEYFYGQPALLRLGKGENGRTTAFRHPGPYQPTFRRVNVWTDPRPSMSRRRTLFDLRSDRWGVLDEVQVNKRFETKSSVAAGVWPRLDGFSVDVVKRQCFKSSWDPEFYYGHVFYGAITRDTAVLKRTLNDVELEVDRPRPEKT